MAIAMVTVATAVIVIIFDIISSLTVFDYCIAFSSTCIDLDVKLVPEL